MTVKIADIYNPVVFAGAEQQAQTEKNAFIASGVMIEDPLLSQGSGNTGELTNYKPLSTDSEPRYSSDDDTDINTAHGKIDKAVQKFRLASLNESWSTMDLAAELALQNPVSAITGRIGQYWATQLQKRLIASTVGVIADNTANDSGDMGISVATDASGAATAGELISAELVIDAQATNGDMQDAFNAIAVHPVVYANLRKQGLIDFIRDADNNTLFTMYQDMRIVVDSGLPAAAGTNRVSYTSILFREGFFRSGMRPVETPSELDRDPDAGNGGGQLKIYSRRADIIHPLGFSFTSNSVAGQAATLAELRTAANWDRQYDRKNCGMAYIVTNG